MKIAAGEQHVKSSYGLQDTKGFSIRANAHAFKMLSSGLYSDKIGAVLREIGCNAYDAHVAAGIADRPIEVKLPNRVDNQFYIRDWGPGLSHEEVMNLYTTYFESTKQTSNDYTGAFGLGSKSPFSYTDSFAVVSVHGGKKRSYSAHLNNTGSPTIALLSEEDAPADWQSGISVGFPVKPLDYSEFQTKAQSIFRWFRTLPKVEGAPAIAPVVVKRDDTEFLLVEPNTGPSTLMALMGNVSYPIELGQIAGMSTPAKMSGHFPNVVLKVPIGAIQVAASRESLQYDKDTSAELGRRLATVVQLLAAEAADRLRKFEKADWVDKCKTLDDVTMWGNNRYMPWKDIFTATGMKDSAALVDTLHSRSFPVPATSGRDTAFRILVAGARNVQHVVVREGKIKQKYTSRDASVDLKEKTAVYYGSAPHALARARQKVVDGDVAQLVLITPAIGGDAAKVADEVKTLKAALKGIPTFDIATVPVPPAALARSGKGKKRAKTTALTPLPSVRVPVWDKDAEEATVDISTLKPADRHFMCKMSNTSSWSDKHVRLFDQHADKDKSWSKRDWELVWGAFIELQEALGLAVTDKMPFISATEVRSVDLVKRGWRSTHEVIREWALSAKVRDEVAKAAAKWRPTAVTIKPISQLSWAEAMVSMWINYRQEFDGIVASLRRAPLHLDKAVAEIGAATVAAGKGAGKTAPPELALYTTLANTFGAPPITTVGTRNYTTVEALNEEICKAHPLLHKFSPAHLVELARHHPGKLPDFAKLLFTT